MVNEAQRSKQFLLSHISTSKWLNIHYHEYDSELEETSLYSLREVRI